MTAEHMAVGALAVGAWGTVDGVPTHLPSYAHGQRVEKALGDKALMALAERIGAAYVAVQDGLDQETILGMLDGRLKWDGNEVVQA